MIEPKKYKDIQGVYMIVQPDGRYYIGSSVELYNRLRAHKCYFSPKSRDYKRINYTCKWSELRFYILKKTDGLNKSQIKKAEQKYLDLYWSDGILNIERVTKGRDINGEKNPMYRIIPKVYCLDCSTQISYHTTKQAKRCKSCASKMRTRDENTKSFI
jgi:predicted GIY-YIG superfamily endonuclease/DNA-directed RNA polymerase subunit RPC12/RpoP